MGAATSPGASPVQVPPGHWDRLFAPSSCLATVTTVDPAGHVNAASFGTCTRVRHDPVTIAFTVGAGKDTYDNVLATGEFVANLPACERRQLEQVRITGLNFAPGVNELERAGLTALPGLAVRPPRIAEFGRHFECAVEWTKQWEDRLMVVGRVVSASCAPGLVDADGYLVWERARPVHYCGWPYDDAFVSAYEVLHVDLPYDGPEAGSGERPVPPGLAGQAAGRGGPA